MNIANKLKPCETEIENIFSSTYYNLYIIHVGNEINRNTTNTFHLRGCFQHKS